MGTSTYGRMSLSLMNFQMMRVISSPSISTTGFCTLIFAMLRSHLLRVGNDRRIDGRLDARHGSRGLGTRGGVYSTNGQLQKQPQYARFLGVPRQRRWLIGQPPVHKTVM